MAIGIASAKRSGNNSTGGTRGAGKLLMYF
jgi:hypothetical protein